MVKPIVNFQVVDSKLIEQRFTRLSETRFIKLLSHFNYAQANAIHLIPFLFHVNHPLLPGYVDKNTPCGLPNYSPNQLAIQLAKGISKSFEFKPRAYFKYEVASLYLMGSMGTLGQSFDSDLDLWVCITDELDIDQRVKLKRKINLISQWLKTLGITLNGYLVHCDDFKTHQQKSLSEESCGDTQNYLLLDEFFRTAIWLSGKKPLWWVIPPDKNYQGYQEQLNRQRIKQHDWIDFGEVESIPVNECFTASLWHFYKAIESPYKSLVKLILLEVYARDLSHKQLLSTEYKTLVYQDVTDIEKLDPYAMLLQKAESILKHQPERLEFLRRAFYLKTSCKIELKNKIKQDWRYQEIYQLVKAWGWNQARLDYLNQRLDWNVSHLLKERQHLIRELNQSFDFLSGLGNKEERLENTNQEELKLLKRQLDAVFLEKTGKLLKINYGITKGLLETEVTLFKKAEKQWLIYSSALEQSELALRQPFYLAESIFQLLAWAVYNKIISLTTSYRVYSDNLLYTDESLNKLVKNLLAENNLLEKSNSPDFLQQEKTNQIAIYLNTKNDPLSLEKEQGIYSVVEEADIFSWGKNTVNLIEQFDLLLVNSWGEYSTRSYQAKTAWLDFFIEYLDGFQSDSEFITKQLQLFNQSELPDHYFQDRLMSLLDTWNQLVGFSQNEQKPYVYLMALGDGYLRIAFEPGQVSYDFYSSKDKLIETLDKNNLIECLIDPYLKGIDPKIV